MIEIYADGSSTGRVGAGGWGYAILDSGLLVHEAYGGADNTTNNKMELQAVIEALHYMQNNYPDTAAFTIYSDSQYVIKGINDWYDGWVIKMRLGLKKVKNWDLWTTIGPLSREFMNGEFKWVRGHDGNKWNEYVDGLAKTGKLMIQNRSEYH